MVSLRPHILKWRTLDSPSGETPEGYPIPGTPGEDKEIGCRFHLESSKVYKNEDSTEVAQVGQIRCNVCIIPQVGQMVQVVEGDYVHFSGIVREVFKGQLSYRLEV
jgi:transcription antitermination factor NusG